jgi:hypothetical protein
MSDRLMGHQRAGRRGKPGVTARRRIRTSAAAPSWDEAMRDRYRRAAEHHRRRTALAAFGAAAGLGWAEAAR